MGWIRKWLERRDAGSDLEMIFDGLGGEEMTRDKALQIPMVSASIEYIAGVVARLPIKLYRDEGGGKITEMQDDPRLRRLNDDTGDILSGQQWKKAVVEDYFLDGAAYLYKNMKGNRLESLHYVRPQEVSVQASTDPIFKMADISVRGKPYRDFAFIKITRKTKDGVTGAGIVREESELLKTAYAVLRQEKTVFNAGGNKRGFLKSEHTLSKEAMTELKNQFRKFYSADNADAVIVLNKGLDFTQASSTVAEMQLTDNKTKNALEIGRLFGVCPEVVGGAATAEQNSQSIRTGVVPVLTAIEAALNKDLLLEAEKDSYYFAFDVKEMDRGDIQKRYAAYTQAVRAGWISKNEIRYNEDLEPVDGLDTVSMSLGDVIFDVKSGKYFTPNLDAIHDMQGKGGEEKQWKSESETTQLP